MNPITEIKQIHSRLPQPTKRQLVKPRRVRRQEQRDHVKAARLNENQKKNDRLSA
jgi:hypothetical protein